MNIRLFGLIVGGLGLALILIGSLTVLASLDSGKSRAEWEAWAREYSAPRTHMGIRIEGPSAGAYAQYQQHIDYLNGIRRQCLYSRIGEPECPISGYSALFNYIGLFVAVIGGGIFVASRNPNVAPGH